MKNNPLSLRYSATRKLWITIIVIAIVAAIAFAFSPRRTPVPAADKQVVKIGVILPLTGEAAHFGDAAKIGIKMFEQDVADSGFQYRIILEDNMLNPGKTATIAHKMIHADKVDVIISLASDIGMVVSPIAQREKVLHFAIATEERIADGDYNFLNATPPNKHAEKLIRELEKRKYKRPALIIQNNHMMMSVADYIRKYANESKKLNLVFNEIVNPGEKDYRLLIAKALKSKPDIIVAQLYIPEILIFAKQLREQDKNIPITTIESFGYSEDKSLFENQWYIDITVPTGDFIARYKEFSNSENTYFAEFLHVVLNVIKDNVDKSMSKEQIIENTLKYKNKNTVVGQISYDGRGILQTESSVKIIKNGMPVVIKE